MPQRRDARLAAGALSKTNVVYLPKLRRAMNKIERVNAAVRGQPVDRVPASVWGHDYLREWTPEGVAQAMLENYHAYDWDYMKFNPRASYHVEDWGAKLEPSGNANQGPRFISIPVQEAGDWRRLRPLNPNKGAGRAASGAAHHCERTE